MTSRRSFNTSLLALVAAGPLGACASLSPKRRISAVDCHAHVFRRDLPMPDRRRAPSGYDATAQDYLRMLDANGMSHGVLVQPSFLGTDNSYLVQSLRQYPDRLRGIAVVDPAITVAGLDLLQDAGVVGIRLNLVGLPTPDFSSVVWQALLQQVRQRRWHIEVHRAAAELQPVLDPLIATGVRIVVDHIGRPDGKLGVADPGFRTLLSVASSRLVWVKLSGAYRNGPDGAGEATALAAMPLLKAAFGLDRLVWGSDWPHTLFEKTATYAGARQLLDQWLPDAAERSVVLRETPAELFFFGA